jgi:uncharacterized protein YciI
VQRHRCVAEADSAPPEGTIEVDHPRPHIMTQTYLYVLRPNRLAMLVEGPTDEETRSLERHVAYLERLTERGTVVLFGRTQTTGAETMGLVVFEAADLSAAESLMRDDPAVRDGLMSAKLYPYRIAGMRGISADA